MCYRDACKKKYHCDDHCDYYNSKDRFYDCCKRKCHYHDRCDHYNPKDRFYDCCKKAYKKKYCRC